MSTPMKLSFKQMGSTYGKLFIMIAREKPLYIALLLLSVLFTSGIQVSTVWLMKAVLSSAEHFLQTHSGFHVTLMLLVLYGLVLIVAALTNISRKLVVVQTQHAAIDILETKVFGKIQSTRLEAFEQPQLHDALQRARSAINSGQFIGVLQRVLMIGIDFFSLCGIVVLLFSFSSWMVLALLLSVVPLAVIRTKRGKDFWNLRWFQSERQRRLSYYSEVLRSRKEAKEMRTFNLASFFLGRWETERDLLREERWAFEKKSLRLELLFNIGIAEFFGFCAALIVATMAVLNGSLEVSAFVAVIFAIRLFQDSLRSMTIQFSYAVQGASFLGDLYHFLDNREIELVQEHEEKTKWQTDETDTNEKRLLLPANTIEIKQLSFAYPESERHVLEGINFSVKPGSVVAIVGPNGAGKSTLVKLLMGIYSPTAGSIYWDEQLIKAAHLPELRTYHTVIFQDFVCYQYSIRENVSFGNWDQLHHDEKIYDVLRKSGADAILQEKGVGLETRLGSEFPGSRDLSGGQWQRIAMSRALMKDAPFLVVDEPTSSLDPLREAELYRQFQKLTAGKTTWMVSHRLASCRFADVILVLDQGRLIQQGNHEQLLAEAGLYADMFREQAKWHVASF